MTINLCYSRVSRRRALSEPITSLITNLVVDLAARPDQVVESREVLDVLQRGIDALPPKQQTAIILYYLHGYSLAEASEIADCNVGTMKSRLHYALKALRVRLPIERRLPVGSPAAVRVTPMSCKRVCRELLWLARFGELGVDSQPHLDHLTTCRGCRDEVGFDRAMVEQLRAALAERIAHAAPPPDAWETILARARAPEPRPMGWRAWSSALVGRLRLTALAASGLALVLALNTQVVPMTVPATTTDAGSPPSVRLARDAQRATARRPQPTSSGLDLSDGGIGHRRGRRLHDDDAAAAAGRRGAASRRPAEQPATTEVRVVFLAADTYASEWPDEAERRGGRAGTGAAGIGAWRTFLKR